MINTYMLIPIAITLLILYGCSWFFSRFGLLKKSLHLRIWNWILLMTFLVTAVLGTVMVVQINRKLDIPLTEILLKWHVNFGITMSFIGIFHFLTHLDYYFKRRRNSTPVSPPLSPVIFPVLPFAFLIGFTGILSQTLVIREFLSLFEGNEFNLALIFFSWMILTGSGAVMGRRKKLPLPEKTILSLPFLLTLVPVISLLLPGIVSYLLIPSGSESGPLTLLGLSVLVLIPICFINGFSFTYAASQYRFQSIQNQPGKVYGWESIGGMAAGTGVTLMILSGWSNIQIYLLLILPVIIGFDIIIFQKKKYQAIRILPLPILLLLILFLFFPIEKWMTHLHYPNQEWVDEAYGHSGHSLLTRSAGQLSFYQNGILMESYGDPLKNEELVHFNMLQRDTCDYVLIIGGALLHLQHEIDKYPIKGADYLEADHSVINMGERNQLLPKGKNVRVIRTSVLPFLRHTQRKYGSVLINLPGPLSISLDRFYERSFFIRLKKVMTVEGVVTFVLPGTANYLSESAVETISSVQNTIQEIFRHVLLLPGESTYLLASDRSLKSNISEQYVLKGIQNTYVNNDYFSPIVFLPRVKWLNNISKPDNNLNTINHPKAFGNQLVWWFNRWNMSWAFLVLLVIIPFIAGIAYMRGPFRPGMFSAGFISTGSEILLLFAVQMITGNLYLLMGLMSALFMGGLALGSFLSLRFLSGRRYLTLYILLGVITLIPALLAWGTSHLDLVTDPEIWTLSMIMICQILIAWITGTYYRFGSMGHQEHESGGLFYGLDLYGAAAGSLVIPLILFPRFGIAGSFLALSAFGFVTLMIETALKGRFVSSP